MKPMRNFLTWLSRRRFPYEPLISVEISKSRLLHNLDEFKKLSPPGGIAPVLKSNAYGHGLIEVAKILEWSGQPIPFFIVDSYFEAIALRAKHIRTPILVIGYTRPETILNARLKNVSFAVTSLETLRALARDIPPPPLPEGGQLSISLPFLRPQCKSRIHLKIDTGMRRQGILPDEIGQAIDLISGDPELCLEGICSHLSDADNADESFTDAQIHIWNKAVKQFKQAFPRLKYWHLANSDGHRFTSDADANVSRLGIGLYGLSENRAFVKELDLKPVMEMKTVVTDVKKLKAGETVGYGNTFKAVNDMTIATIPAGYYEGIDRRLSNSGTILVGLERIPCPIIGRVSMNITSIDVSKVKDPKIGDVAIIISNDANDQNSFASIAKLCGTITYEGAVKIPAQLKREVID